MEVKKRFLLYRIHLTRYNLVIDQGVELAPMVVTHTAGAARALGDAAIMWTEGAQNLSLWQGLIKSGFMQRTHS
jgi:hypothetical protein